jgi:type VI secretion system protein ImpA
MALDIAALVAALSEEQPSGPDLGYDPERQSIESAFERAFEGDTASDEDTDWQDTIRRILAQAEQTRDIWLPVYLMRAAARGGDLEMVSEGAKFLAAVLEERWPDIHPQLEELGFLGRKAPCESLTQFADFLGPLQRTAFLSHQRLGRYTGADFMRFLDEGSSAENYGMFRALIDETPVETLEALAARVTGLRDSIKRVDAVLMEYAEEDSPTNFTPTYELIDRLRKAVNAVLPEPPVEESADDEGESGFSGDGTSGGGASFSGGIRNRRDVERAIDSICAYYAQQEPASPVPFALRRAKEWISLDFMAVLEDIAPGGVEEAAKILKSVKVASDGSASWDSGTSGSESDSGWS